MADTTIHNNCDTYMYRVANRSGPYYKSTTTGYLFYSDNGHDLCWDKTVNGGAAWAGPTEFITGTILSYDTQPDWQTEGDAGLLIHIVYIDGDTNQARYCYFDTADDTIKGDDLIESCQGTGTFQSFSQRTHFDSSITKSRGGNIDVFLKTEDNASVHFDSFYTSPDADTWTSETSPLETYQDMLLLFSANLTDTDDIWALYWDFSASQLTLKTYDDSGDSWSEDVIGACVSDEDDNFNFDGQIRLSDKHLIVACINDLDAATADLTVYDITDGSTITQKTNVISNQSEMVVCSVFIDQTNDDIYVSYLRGTTWQSSVACYYDHSDDGGATWDGETAYQADAEDDMRWISSGAMKAAWGGFFQPAFFNDDLNDIFVNVDNDVAIAAEGGGLSIPVAMHHYTKNMRAG